MNVNSIQKALAILDVLECKQANNDQANNEQAKPLSDFGVGQQCLIRTYSAGVFFGTPLERDGAEMIIKDARRLWSWEGAFTLSAVAQHGINSGKLSIAEPEKLVFGVIEVIPCSNNAANQLAEMEAYKP